MAKPELAKFTNEWFMSSVSSWEKNLTGLPDFEMSNLKKYLVTGRNKTFDKDSLRAYKSLKAYKTFTEGYVQRINRGVIESDSDMFFVKAEVMASMTSRKVYKTFVCLSSEGEVLGAVCECVAGKGQACNHVAGLLFAMEDYVAKGYNELQSTNPTVTDKLCGWNKPANRKVEPKTIHEIKVVKYEHGKAEKERKTFDAIQFDPRRVEQRDLDRDRAKVLAATLQEVNPECNFLKYFNPERTENVVKEIKNPNRVQILPPSIEDIKKECQNFKNSLTLNDEGREQLERDTREQSESVKWKEARRFRLTASRFQKVANRRKTTNPKCLIESLLYNNQKKSTKAMQFGLDMEEPAAERYAAKNNVERLEKRGLVIHKTKQFLGASVDRVAVTSSGHKVVEIKNPSSTWKMSVKQASEKLSCLVQDENGEVCLNHKHEYYAQIQGQMAILGIHKCDFVLCTESDMLVEEVSFDSVYWKACEAKLEAFYDNILLPEIVYPRVKFGLDAVDLANAF